MSLTIESMPLVAAAVGGPTENPSTVAGPAAVEHLRAARR